MPALRSHELTGALCRSLRECLAVTPTLQFLELQNVPLRERDLILLARVLPLCSALLWITLRSDSDDAGLW